MWMPNSFKNASNTVDEKITELINKTVKTGKYLKEIKTGLLITLPKPNRPKETPNYNSP